MKKRIIELIDSKAKYFTDIADYIWDNPELAFKEYKSSKALTDALEENGFEVEKGLAGMPTAFKGVFGSGHPVIGFLAEFDALSNMSQKDGVAHEEPVFTGAAGHGCGHNAIGTSCVAAALAMKDVMEEEKLCGTVVVYGCPGEEGGAGKAFMARDGVFSDMDVAMAPHPSDNNFIMGISSLAVAHVEFRFKGKASHAGAAPHLGRSALDACSLMIVGVQFLREHVIPEARIHHAYLNVGGTAPNVVQADASLLFYIRAPKSSQVKEISERINDIARGAALMTGTTVEIVPHSGANNLLVNGVVGSTLASAWEEIGAQNFSKAAYDAAAVIAPAIPNCDVSAPLDESIPSFEKQNTSMSGSTDVGDASYIAPTVMFMHTGFCKCTPGHTWQLVAQSRSPIMHEGMLHAAKVMALTGLKFIKDPALVKAAWDEHKASGAIYECLIPEDVKPAID